MNRTISPMGRAQIETHEGFRAEAVQLADGRFVAGFGHVTLTAPAKPLTRAEATALLAQDLEPVERAVNALVKIPLQQGPFDALVSFAFSVGVEAFGRSDVLRRVNAREFAAAACAMDAWRKSAVAGEPEVFEVLVRRRAAEKALLLCEHVGAPSVWLKPQIDHAAAILGAPASFGSLPVMGVAPEAAVAPAATEDAPLELETPAPASDAAPVPAARTIKLHAVSKPPMDFSKDQVVFGALTAVGLLLVLAAGVSFYLAAPGQADFGQALFLAVSGGLAAACGLFFLTRRARAAFA